MKHISLRRLAAIVIGIVFIVSGILKISDPVGTMLIVKEYLKFFHIAFLSGAAKGIGIALATTETFVGIGLVTGVWRKAVAIITTVMLVFFTIVTLVLWILNPSMDCGCFGLAIHLTHAQSLIKNIILLALALWAFLPFGDFGETPVRKKISAIIACVSVVLAVFYCNSHLPLVDRTEFRVGAELFASLEDDVAFDNHYRESKTYQKDGQIGKFLPGVYPGDDWELVQTDTLFVENPFAQETFPILSFRDMEDNYCDRMAAEGRVIVFSVYDPSKARWEAIEQQYKAAAEGGATPLVLVACAPSQIQLYSLPASLPLYFADYKTLISLNRSNGGATYIADGEIILKWTSKEVPEDFHGIVADDPVNLSTWKLSRSRLKAQSFCLYLAALLILV